MNLSDYSSRGYLEDTPATFGQILKKLSKLEDNCRIFSTITANTWKLWTEDDEEDDIISTAIDIRRPTRPWSECPGMMNTPSSLPPLNYKKKNSKK